MMSLSRPKHDLEHGFFREEQDSALGLRKLLEAQRDMLRDILRHLENQNVTCLTPESLDSNAPSPCDSRSTLADTVTGPRDQPSEALPGTRHDDRSISTQTDSERKKQRLAHRNIPTPPPSPPTTPARSVPKSRDGQSTQVSSSMDSSLKTPLGSISVSNVAATEVGINMPDPRSLKETQVIRSKDRIKVPWKGYYIVVRLPPPLRRETTAVETTSTETTGTEIMAGGTTVAERVATSERGVVVAARSRRLRSCGPILTVWEFKPRNLPSSPIFPPIFFDTIKFKFGGRR